jgi:hypothetical protein
MIAQALDSLTGAMEPVRAENACMLGARDSGRLRQREAGVIGLIGGAPLQALMAAALIVESEVGASLARAWLIDS